MSVSGRQRSRALSHSDVMNVIALSVIGLSAVTRPGSTLRIESMTWSISRISETVLDALVQMMSIVALFECFVVDSKFLDSKTFED